MKYKSLVLALATLTAGTLYLGTQTANAMTMSGAFGSITKMQDTNFVTVGKHHHGGHHRWWRHGGHNHGGHWGGSGLWLGAGLLPFFGGYYGGYGGYYGGYGSYYVEPSGYPYVGYGDPYGGYYGGYYYRRHCVYKEHISTAYCH
jgi:hypothetical protein